MKKMLSAKLVLVASLLALAACSPKEPEGESHPEAPATPPPSVFESAPDEALVADGRALALVQCGGCHGLDADHESPRTDAPPMSEMLARYNADALAEDLINGIKLGHEDMPQFDFDVMAADALVAYLRSIRED